MKRNLNIYISFEEEWAKLTRKNAFSGQQFVKRPEPFILDPDTSSFFVYSNISQKRMKKTDKERRQELLIVKLCEINFRRFRGTTSIIFSSTKRIFFYPSCFSSNSSFTLFEIRRDLLFFILLAPYLKRSKITSTTLPSISLGSVFRISPERSFPFFSRTNPNKLSREILLFFT